MATNYYSAGDEFQRTDRYTFYWDEQAEIRRGVVEPKGILVSKRPIFWTNSPSCLKDYYPYVIEIVFINNTFDSVKFEFITNNQYNREDWRVLAAIERKITELEESYARKNDD